MTSTGARPMWTCPDCGRSFVNTNQAHACQTTTVDDYLVGKTDHAVSIYKAVVAALETAGDFRIHPQKTRIAFISRMTFGGVSLARKWADVGFILPEPLDDGRIRRLELYGPTSWGHSVRLDSPDDVDDDVRSWLAAALLRGDQETLDPSHEVTPLNMRQLEIFWTGFRAKVSGERVALPGYVADALALVDHVSAQVGGNKADAILQRSGGVTYVAVDPTLELGEGDETDVFLKLSD
ncbi:MAG: DUF5655 domain-containing protein [Acidimicrobiia bacterium]